MSKDKGSVSLPVAVNALLKFMQQQIEQNKAIRGDLSLINEYVYEPEMRKKYNIRCMSAIL